MIIITLDLLLKEENDLQTAKSRAIIERILNLKISEDGKNASN